MEQKFANHRRNISSSFLLVQGNVPSTLAAFVIHISVHRIHIRPDSLRSKRQPLPGEVFGGLHKEIRNSKLPTP